MNDDPTSAYDRMCWMCGNQRTVYEDVLGLMWCEPCIAETENAIAYKYRK